jgi:hypothetical protein
VEAEGGGGGFHLELGDEVDSFAPLAHSALRPAFCCLSRLHTFDSAPSIVKEAAVLGQDPFVGDEGFDQFAHAAGLVVIGESEALAGQALALGGGGGLQGVFIL